jgi:hypothetical protein
MSNPHVQNSQYISNYAIRCNLARLHEAAAVLSTIIQIRKAEEMYNSFNQQFALTGMLTGFPGISRSPIIFPPAKNKPFKTEKRKERRT